MNWSLLNSNISKFYNVKNSKITLTHKTHLTLLLKRYAVRINYKHSDTSGFSIKLCNRKPVVFSNCNAFHPHIPLR